MVPNASSSVPDHPQVFVTDKKFTKSADLYLDPYRRAGPNQHLEVHTLHLPTPRGVHGARFVDRNDAVFGAPWSAGLGADKKNGIGQLTTLESSTKSLFRGLTLGPAAAVVASLPVPDELSAFRGSGG